MKSSDVIFHRSDLNDGFLWRGLFASEQILGIAAALRVAGLTISIVLRFAEIMISFYL